MKLDDGYIEITEEEVRYLWRQIWKDEIPEGLGLESAATAIKMTLSTDTMIERLEQRKAEKEQIDPREFDESD